MPLLGLSKRPLQAKELPNSGDDGCGSEHIFQPDAPVPALREELGRDVAAFEEPGHEGAGQAQ